MPQLRRDPLFDRWVIVAPQRAARPLDFTPATSSTASRENCPFCEGQESQAQPEVLAIRAPGTAADAPGWSVRVVANKYPVATLAAGDDQLAGVHDVIIESPRHVASWVALTDAEVEQVLGIYQTRLDQLRHDGRWRYALVFKNVGDHGGASLEHVHSQLLALPTVPDEIARHEQALADHYEEHEVCGICCIAADENRGPRRVAESTHFIAYCPYASRQPYETCVVPKHHEPHVERMTDDERCDLAQLLRRVLGAIEAQQPTPAYNLCWQSTPWGTTHPAASHWRLEIIPRITKAAGFEWASGWNINPVEPELAAERLRAQL